MLERSYQKASSSRFSHIPQTILSNLADQFLRHGLVVGNLKKVPGRLVLLELRVKWLQRRRCWREVAVCLVRRESEQESGLHEEGHSPLDYLLGPRRDALEDRVQPPQMRLGLRWGRANILGNCRRTIACHLVCLNDRRGFRRI